MEKLSTSEIRSRFLEFFQERGHRVLPSSGLVPAQDPTLLFTNAGMVQFKDVFTGAETRDYARATTSQKCVRAGGKHNDLENVGVTSRHHTFFEMLGNFSFGDYFKSEAISFAWDFLTKVLGLPEERLWPTVFRDDDEAAQIWRDEIGVPAERVLRFDEKDNFWAMGDTGPCGPCSEILFDLGPEAASMPADTPPGEDGERYLEIWNLVFMQFQRDAEGNMTPLPKPSIDTGAGLERLSAVLGNLGSNYETDVLRPLVDLAGEIAGKKYGATQSEDDTSMRVIADHARSTTFLIADGVLPSNEGRGYVLRRIMRRAIRHGERLGISEPFFARVCADVVARMGDHYKELVDAKTLIAGVVSEEEAKFRQTLAQGLKLINERISALKSENAQVIPGETVFELHATYGFPPDLTEIIAGEQSMEIDQAGFEAAQQKHKELGGFKGDQNAALTQLYQQLAAEHGATTFTGYQDSDGEGKVLAILKDGALVPEAGEGDKVEVVVDRSPFYAEGGGQVGDIGVITTPAGVITVGDCQKPSGDMYVHRGEVSTGRIAVGDSVGLKVDWDRRELIRRNHSATHLLHSALRQVAGDHVRQAGSYVDGERLRFDFSHFSALEPQQLAEIEGLANDWVRANYEVETAEVPFAEAQAAGALAFFGDKYGDLVKMVRMGPPSLELCGGTHVSQTGDIGFIKLLSEQGIAAGTRRVEGTSGAGAVTHIQGMEGVLRATSDQLRGTATHEIADRVKKLREREKELLKEIETLKQKLAAGASGDLLAGAKEIGGVKVLATVLDGQDPKGLRDLADKLRDKMGSGVMCLGVKAGPKALLLVGVTKDLTGRFKAGDLVREVAAVVGGKGGGRPDMAQAGGPDGDKLPEAIAKFEALIAAAG